MTKIGRGLQGLVFGEYMKISIITVTWNSARTILDTVASVNAQDYENIEHIVVDGCSTDGTLELLEENPGRISMVVSEPDKGIYDAMNKGIALATGEVIAILNSDDIYSSVSVVSRFAKAFSDPTVQVAFSDLVYVDQEDTDRVLRRWKSSAHRKGAFARGWHPPHPTLFVRKQCYDEFGGFDLDLAVSADFELMLRFFEEEQLSSSYLPFTAVRMRTGGESNGSLKNVIKGNLNILKAFKKHGISVCGVCYVSKRLLLKVLQYRKSVFS